MTLRERGPDVVALLLCLAALVVGWRFSTRVAGGADSYGYISQGLLLADGRFGPQPPILSAAPWKDATATLAPLGYRPSVDGHSVVPVYPPGLPLLFAAAHRFGGMPALFAVVPICGALALAFAYLLARSFLKPWPSILVPLLLASFPAFLHQLFQPMSDVPVTAAWLAVLVGVIRSIRGMRGGGSAKGLLAAGLAASIAVLIRPNLAPLTALPALFLAWTAPAGSRLRAVALFSVGVLPGAATLAGFNAVWYGSPIASGYGSFDELFGAEHILPNLRNYLSWWCTQHTPFLLLGLPLLLVPFRRLVERSAQLLLGSFAIGTLGLYLAYGEFSDATYLRFLLPMVAPLAILVLAGTERWLPGPGYRTLLIGLALYAAAFGFRRSWEFGSFDLAASEHRYVEVADYAKRFLEPRAVFVAMQHAGSLRFYADRTTVRWDCLAPRGFDRALAWLEASGRPVYFALESWEIEELGQKFPDSRYRAFDWTPVADVGGVRFYRPQSFVSLRAGRETLDRRRPSSHPRPAVPRSGRPG